MAEDVNIRLIAKIDDAAKSFNNFERSTNKSLKSVEKATLSVSRSVNGIGATIVKVNQAVQLFGGIIRGVSSAVGSFIDAAARQEDAVNNLNAALATSGEFSEGASQELQDFASALQQVTRFGDEAILEQLSLAKSFGATNEQAKQVTQASIELAAATGKSLTEANRQVAKTLGGFAGELGEVNPAIKALTSEQLRAGEAARVLLEQFGGTAQAQLNTFSGAVAQLSNTFGDFQETIGQFITQNPIVIALIREINKAIKDLDNSIKENEQSIVSFISDALVALINTIGFVLKSLSLLERGFRVLIAVIEILGNRLASAVVGFERLANADFSGFAAVIRAEVEDAGKSIERALGPTITERAARGFKSFGERAKAAIRGVQNELNNIPKTQLVEFSIDVKKLEDSLKNVGKTQVQIIEEERQARLKVIDDFINKNQNLQESQIMELADLRERVELDAIEKLEKARLDAAKQNAPSLRKVLEQAIGVELQVSQEAGAFTQVIGQLTSAFKQGGREGGVALIGAVADTVVPGLGQILGFFAQGAEAVREQIVSTITAIPEIITAILDAIGQLPVILAEAAIGFIEALIDNIPIIIENLITNAVASLPRIITAIIQALPSIISGFINLLPRIVQGFINAFIKEVPKLVQELAKALVDAITDLFGGIGGEGIAGTGILGSEGILGIKGIPFLQDGGTVRGGPPFTDRIPAVLSPGEFVVDRTDTRVLVDFLGEASDMGGFEGLAQRLDNLTSALLGQPSRSAPVRVTEGDIQKAVASLILDINTNGLRTTR